MTRRAVGTGISTAGTYTALTAPITVTPAALRHVEGSDTLTFSPLVNSFLVLAPTGCHTYVGQWQKGESSYVSICRLLHSQSSPQNALTHNPALGQERTVSQSYVTREI